MHKTHGKLCHPPYKMTTKFGDTESMPSIPSLTQSSTSSTEELLTLKKNSNLNSKKTNSNQVLTFNSMTSSKAFYLCNNPKKLSSNVIQVSVYYIKGN